MQDIQLIWTNCKAYNQPDSVFCLVIILKEIYRMAEHMEKVVRKAAEKLRVTVGPRKKEGKEMPEEADDEIPPDDPSA